MSHDPSDDVYSLSLVSVYRVHASSIVGITYRTRAAGSVVKLPARAVRVWVTPVLGAVDRCVTCDLPLMLKSNS